VSVDHFHLGWFLSFRPPIWNGPWHSSDDASWMNGEFYIDMARSLERAGFDYMMFEDSSMVSDAYAGSSEVDLKYALYAPKGDPIPLLGMLAQATRHIGLVATMSTSFYPPFLLARTMSTLDHLTRGRVGWNIVTSSEDRAAQNYGMEKLFEHDLRYDRADEFVDLVSQLWKSWEDDALIMDEERNVYVDHAKVRPINFEGKYFKSRGPLNTLPSPQGRPVFCQAGGSPRGRDFAAAHADTIIASAQGIPAMKAFRDDIHARMEAAGRKPESCKILFVVSPVLADTVADAEERVSRMKARAAGNVEFALGHLSALTENDFSTYDLDAPIPEVSTNGHRSTLSDFVRQGAGGKTLREVAANWTINSVELVGTPDSVAATMGETMDEVGGDGFLISGQLNRRFVSEIADGLAPALQARGLTRTSYTYDHFRDNLLEY
jgi:FMN-dependent oxidoreductase (nitrilotriacetate monooxygenase family)